ncbi:MAG: hypothetical protein Q7S74_00825 [Nanoarchaeota archaeon]|nr:hypothetical protein [Nanoarchaeota archaeon]
MAEDKNEFKEGETIIIGNCIGLPAELPSGLVEGQKFKVDQIKWSDATTTIEPRLKLHLEGYAKEKFYDAIWFEYERGYFPRQKPFICGCYFPNVQRKKDNPKKMVRTIYCIKHKEYEIPLINNSTEPLETTIMSEKDRKSWIEWYAYTTKKDSSVL